MGFRYIGSKARIARDIMEYIGGPVDVESKFMDAFSGTGAVANAAADQGWKVHVNDTLPSATTIAVSRLLSTVDVPFESIGGYQIACDKLNGIERDGYFWREYSPASLAHDEARIAGC